MRGKIKFGIITLLFVFSIGILAGCGQSKKEEYRQIKVHKVDGTANVERQGSSMEAYQNMQLQSGDLAETIMESYVQLRLDEDKYILMEPDTKISLVASGNEVDSKTSIYLEKGAIINQIDNPLSEGSSYEVTTPNSTMAVRGTTFRVALTVDETGATHTAVGVYGGKVESQLVFPDGTIGEPVIVETGNQVLIRGDEIDSEYVGTDNINYEDLNETAIDFLGEAVERGKELSVTKEELKVLKEAAVLKNKTKTEDKTEEIKSAEQLKTEEKAEEGIETEEKKPEFESLENTETIVSDPLIEIPKLEEEIEVEEDIFDDFYLTDDSENENNEDGNTENGESDSSGNEGNGSGSGSSGNGGSGNDSSGDGENEGGGTGEDDTEVTENRTVVISFYSDGQLFTTKEQTVDSTTTSITVTKPILQPFESSADIKGWQIKESKEFWIEGFDSNNADYPYVFLEGSSENISFNAGAEELSISFQYITAE